MPPSDSDVLAAGILLAALTPLVLFGPLRWAVLGWLVMAQLDASGSGRATYAQLGWLNAFKSVAAPLWLLWRLRAVPSALHRSWVARAWLLLAGYALTASLWSPFPLAGVKMAVGMVAMLASLVAMEKAVRAGALGTRTLAVFTLATLLLAAVHVAAFGDGSFGFAGRGMPARFTSFVAAQQYAALLAALIAWTLWRRDLPSRLGEALTPALFAALAANGSRTWSLGALATVSIHAGASRRWTSWLRVAIAVALLASVPAMRRGLAKQAEGEPANRLTATASAILTGEDRAGGMGLGTLRFRLAMYRGVLEEMRSSPLRTWCLGHGSGSGGSLAVRLFPWAYRLESLDANRVIHNEWLRVLYEWGAVGAALWAAVVGGVLVFAWRRRRDAAGAALFSYVPAWMLGLTMENLLDGAGNAVTTGFLLLVAQAAAVSRAPGRESTP